MKYIVYLTKNIINQKIYVGVHGTDNPYGWDYYLGDGSYANKPSSYMHKQTPFHAALRKYGVKNFKRTVLAIFDTEQEALNLESAIVNEKFIRLKTTYNIVLGGGKPPVLNKITYQYDLEGNFIKEWNSVKDAADYYKISASDISHAVYTSKNYGGYYWTRTKFEILDLNDFIRVDYKTSVGVFNKDRQLLNRFESLADAGRFYDFDPKAIANAIHDKCSLFELYFVPSRILESDFFSMIDDRNIVAKTPIYKYDLITGDFIESFNSVVDAKKACGLKSHSRIVSAAKNGKTSGGFRWSYDKVDNVLNQNVSRCSKKPTKIGQYINNKLIKVWNIDECRKQYPNCIKVCRGARNQAYGYGWQYIYDN